MVTRETTLVFSIGPVQGFIAQSRRTADGWVGSYLLSYLAGLALASFEEKLGEVNIIEPDVQDVALYDAIRKQRALTSPGLGLRPKSIAGDTTVAALPNVLVLNVPNGDCFQLGKEAKDAVVTAWEIIQGKVFSALPDSMKNSSEVQAIWKCQIKHHWECNWAWGENSREAFDNLAARKGLRNFEPREEEGDRCTVCAQREALWKKSSYDKWDPVTKKGRHHQVRDAARENWRGWAEEINDWKKAPSTLLHPDGKERLCAICLIKRLIPWVSNPILDVWKAGQKSPSKPSVFPSTSTMATVRYRAELVKKACGHNDLRKTLNAYFEALKRPGKGYGSRADPLDAFPCWALAMDKAVRCGWDQERVERLLRMDGDWYLYGEAVRNEELKGTLKDHTGKVDEKEVEKVHQTIQDAYHELTRAAREARVDPAPIYYAVLTMDGDRMGDFKETVVKVWENNSALIKEKLQDISGKLNQFAHAVPGIVREKDGRTVYAGGDDVLALLPLETALEAAEAIRQEFAKLFTEWLEEQKKKDPDHYCKIPVDHKTRTISASIVFAHHQAPLGRVLREGHTLLVEWAKKRAGRDAVALQHYQRGGPSTTCAIPWEIDGKPVADRLDTLQKQLTGEDRQVAARFVYGLQEAAWMFEDGGPFADPSNHDGEDYLKTRLLKSRLGEEKPEKEREQQAQQLARDILSLSRNAVGGDKKGFSTEPLLLARFLAGGGREER